jgi:hypothetical protein
MGNPCRNVCSLIALDNDHWQCNECKAVFAFVEPPRYSPAMCPHGVKWGFGECSQCDANEKPCASG